jgi:hypothetical protein
MTFVVPIASFFTASPALAQPTSLAKIAVVKLLLSLSDIGPA